ncbi:MAG: hypothetical protein MJ201_05010 [Mycoplasmoidaceae bacterium]|nr:hypothetical protein [Mycoplasmoidaceae bacterium]
MEDIEKVKVQPTEKIEVERNENIEDELRELTKDELLHRLNYEETDPEIIKLIKKILKTKA